MCIPYTISDRPGLSTQGSSLPPRPFAHSRHSRLCCRNPGRYPTAGSESRRAYSCANDLCYFKVPARPILRKVSILRRVTKGLVADRSCLSSFYNCHGNTCSIRKVRYTASSMQSPVPLGPTFWDRPQKPL